MPLRIIDILRNVHPELSGLRHSGFADDEHFSALSDEIPCEYTSILPVRKNVVIKDNYHQTLVRVLFPTGVVIIYKLTHQSFSENEFQR